MLGGSSAANGWIGDCGRLSFDGRSGQLFRERHGESYSARPE